MSLQEFVLTLSCPNRPGIVAGVATFLAEAGFNMLTPRQFRAGGIEADIDLPLNAPLGVPLRFAMAHQTDACSRGCRDFHHFLSFAFAVNC